MSEISFRPVGSGNFDRNKASYEAQMTPGKQWTSEKGPSQFQREQISVQSWNVNREERTEPEYSHVSGI